MLIRPLDWDCARLLCLLTVASHFIPRNHSRVLTWLSIRFKIRAAIHLCSVLNVIDAKLHERRHYLVTCILHIARSIAVSSAKICIEENRDKGELYEGAANYSWTIIYSWLKGRFLLKFDAWNKSFLITDEQIENLLRFFLNLKLLWIKFCNKQIMCIIVCVLQWQAYKRKCLFLIQIILSIRLTIL